jgi:predicted nucleotide-binding protein
MMTTASAHPGGGRFALSFYPLAYTLVRAVRWRTASLVVQGLAITLADRAGLSRTSSLAPEWKMDLSQFDPLITKGRHLLFEDRDMEAQGAFREWDELVADWLSEQAPQSGLSAEWSALGMPRLDLEMRGWPRPQLWVEYRQIVQERLAWLSRLARSARTPASSGSDGAGLQPGGKIFVVHGHDGGIRETVARYLERLQLEPIILHEQPDQGRTIIEKFLDFADVGFAVIILTGDDQGAARGRKSATPRPRARQNVIFELGFFIGRLGRERVCALYEEGVEIPSDYEGILLVPLDGTETWKLRLAKEMKAAGVPVDLNRIL